jgi:A/G-specific adenine glycosylase
VHGVCLDRLAQALVSWFASAARDLPWRRTLDPYAIWVSEIMLQQTQVATVIPYWLRWMKALPTVQALAQASEPEMLKLWEGLGYYSRVRNLQKAARIIVAEHAGTVPFEHASLLKLPGIGAYTAGAIASIAFNLPRPILDGNVTRVLTRLFHIRSNVAEKRVKDSLWILADRLVRAAAGLPSKRPCSALNQALMELGATVCRPEKPDCPACPLREFCEARLRGDPESLPLKTRPVPAKKKNTAAFLLVRDNRIWLRQRPKEGVNAGFWELPNAPVPNLRNKTIQMAAEQELGFRPAALIAVGRIAHSITSTRYQLSCHRVEEGTGTATPGNGKWFALNQLETTPLSGAHARLLRSLELERSLTST